MQMEDDTATLTAAGFTPGTRVGMVSGDHSEAGMIIHSGSSSIILRDGLQHGYPAGSMVVVLSSLPDWATGAPTTIAPTTATPTTAPPTTAPPTTAPTDEPIGCDICYGDSYIDDDVAEPGSVFDERTGHTCFASDRSAGRQCYAPDWRGRCGRGWRGSSRGHVLCGAGVKLNLWRCEGRVEVERRVTEEECRVLKSRNDHGKVFEHALYDSKKDRCFLCESFLTGPWSWVFGRTSRANRRTHAGDLRWHSLSAERGGTAQGGGASTAAAVGAAAALAVAAAIAAACFAARKRAAAARSALSAENTGALIRGDETDGLEKAGAPECVDV